LVLAVVGIRIWNRVIRMFLGLPDPDPLVKGADPAPDPEKYEEKNYFFFASL
jgi:hypothetical protein